MEELAILIIPLFLFGFGYMLGWIHKKELMEKVKVVSTKKKGKKHVRRK